MPGRRGIGNPCGGVSNETYKWRMRALTAERRLSVAAGGLLRLAQPSWDGKGSGSSEMADYAGEVLDSLTEAGDSEGRGEDVCALCGSPIEKADGHLTDQGEPIHIVCELTHSLVSE